MDTGSTSRTARRRRTARRQRRGRRVVLGLGRGTRPLPNRMAVVYRNIEPEADFASFAAFMRNTLA